MPPRLLTALKLTIPAVILGAALVSRAWPDAVEARPVVTGDVIDEVLGIGTLESTREVAVGFEASGRVLSLEVDEGDVVAAGDRLGTIDASDAGRELDIARANEAAAVAAVQRARAEVDRAALSATRISADRLRFDALFAAGGISVAEHEGHVEQDAGASAGLRAAQAALRLAEENHHAAVRLTAVRAALLADGQLTSPLSGLVVSRPAEVGQLVTPGAPAFRVVSTEAMVVRAWVDEAALGRLAEGQPARVVFRSEAGRTFAGRLAQIGREVDRQTHELQVEVAVLELPPNFAVGQRADVWIELGRREGVATVPRGWCEEGCLVAEDGRAVQRSLALGLVGRDVVEVKSGLRPGELVLAPAAATAGQRVRVRP